MPRILTLLELLASSDRPVKLTEINDHLNLPKATIHRLLTTLENELFLQREIDDKRFLLGSCLRKIALGVLSNEHFRTERHDILSDSLMTLKRPATFQFLMPVK